MAGAQTLQCVLLFRYFLFAKRSAKQKLHAIWARCWAHIAGVSLLYSAFAGAYCSTVAGALWCIRLHTHAVDQCILEQSDGQPRTRLHFTESSTFQAEEQQSRAAFLSLERSAPE